MNDMVKNLILWMTIAAVMLFLFQNFSQPAQTEQLIYSDLIREVRAGQVAEVTINDINIIGKRTNGTMFRTIPPAPAPYDAGVPAQRLHVATRDRPGESDDVG